MSTMIFSYNALRNSYISSHHPHHHPHSSNVLTPWSTLIKVWGILPNLTWPNLMSSTPFPSMLIFLLCITFSNFSMVWVESNCRLIIEHNGHIWDHIEVTEQTKNTEEQSLPLIFVIHCIVISVELSRSDLCVVASLITITQANGRRLWKMTSAHPALAGQILSSEILSSEILKTVRSSKGSTLDKVFRSI